MVQYMFRIVLPSPEDVKYRNDTPGYTSQKVASVLPATTQECGEVTFQATALGLQLQVPSPTSVHIWPGMGKKLVLASTVQ